MVSPSGSCLVRGDRAQQARWELRSLECSCLVRGDRAQQAHWELRSLECSWAGKCSARPRTFLLRGHPQPVWHSVHRYL